MTQLQQVERREPDWAAAAVAGLAAGAILMVLDLFWSMAITDSGPWAAPRMIAAIVMGPDVMQSTGFSLSAVTVALLLHYAFGVIGGIVLASITTFAGLDRKLGIAVMTGAAFGIVLYFVNFYGMANFFPWFVDVRGWTTLLINLIFGISTAVLYWKLERTGASRPALQEAR